MGRRARRRALARAIRIAAAVVVLGAIGAGTAGGASTANVTVSANFLSATNMDSSACASGTANVTDFGSLLPGSSTVTSSDCSVTFGSNNDTAMLRTYQQDSSGVGMWRAPTGPADTSFDTDGLATITNAATETTETMAVQADGGVVVGGWLSTCPNGEVVLERFLPSGAADGTFGTGGRATPTISATKDEVYGVAIQSDGKILIAGRIHQSGCAASTNVGYVARLTTSGALDATFGVGGVRALSLPFEAILYDVVVDGSGAVYAGGYYFNGDGEALAVKLTSAGALDTTYGGGDGWLNVDCGVGNSCRLYALALQSDGMLVGSGSANNGNDGVVMRMTTAGALDAGFGVSGIRQVDLGGSPDALRDVVVLSSGKTVSAGDNSADAVVVQLTTAGAPDATFGGGDGITSANSGAVDAARGVVAYPDGTIMVAGGAGTDHLYARFTSAGALDGTFDADGMLVRSHDAAADGARGAAIAADGRLATGSQLSTASGDLGATRLDTTQVSQYANGTTDWDTAATNMFGACLRAIGGSTTAQWTVNATCPTTDGAYWNAIPTTAAKIAYSSASGVTTASASLRFGLRTTATQPGGTYVTPLVLEVVAPNA